MRSKYLFLAMAAATMVACTNDDFTQSDSVIGHDNLGKLIKTPMLGVSIEADAETRAYDNSGFLWRPNTDNTTPPKVISSENIGFCWTGVNTGKYGGPLAETGDKVYTNINFEHVGWLYEGEKKPTFLCGELINGEFHNLNTELKPQATYDTGDSRWEPTTGGKNFDYSTGMFKSGNGTIYEGEYIVYFPYNDSFWNAPVTATQDRIMTLDVDNGTGAVVDPYQLMSQYSFNVGYVPSIKGGDEACAFSTKMLTSGIRFYLEANTSAEIKEIVLLSKGEKAFITKQALSAKKIKERILAGSLNTDMYMEFDGNEKASTIVVKTKNASKNLTVTSSQTNFYVPFLPTRISDLKVLLVNEAGLVAELPIGEVEFEPNKPKNLCLYINGNAVYKDAAVIGTFSSVNYAYDEESFVAAFDKARTNAANASVDPRTIKLLDNIDLTSVQTVYNTSSTNDVIIESDEDLAEGEKNLLTLGGIETANRNYIFRNTEFDVDIENIPMGCCNNGKVSLTLIDSKTTTGTSLTLYGTTLTLYSRNIELGGNVYSKFEPEDEDGNTHIDRVPEIVLHEATPNGSVIAKGDFLNEGKMEIPVKTKFELQGGKMTNAKTTVGEDEYRASVTVAGNGNFGEDGVLLMNGGATLKNQGDIYNKGNIDNNSTAGSFTNEGNATFTDFVGSTLSGYRIVNSDNAEFICEVNSEVRYNNAIDPEGIRPTTTLRFVYGTDVNVGSGTFTTTYTLQPQNGKDGIYVPYATKEVLMKFESAISAGETLTLNHATDATPKPISTKIGDLTVKSGKITLNHEDLTIDGNYTADGAANTNFAVGITAITGDLNLKKVVKNSSNGDVFLATGKKLTVGGNVIIDNVAGRVIFRPNSLVDVTGDITVNNVTEVLFDKATHVNAANLTVSNAQKVTFKTNNVTYLGEKGVEGVLTNEGEINIENAVTGSDVAAKVWCNQRVGNGTYVNNSYPQYY